jgi:hypothetical protein
MSHVDGVDDGVGYGVHGRSNSGGNGVIGESIRAPGVHGFSNSNPGVFGFSFRDMGVFGYSIVGHGLNGYSQQGYGLYAYSDGELAAYLHGHVRISGSLSVGGTINKSALLFKIDHPLDPANKYLYHSSVESPDMKNIYDGVVELDDKGEAEIDLPDWFGALNKDFRYQLTAIGAPGPNLYIAEEISEADTKYSDSSSRNDNYNSSFKIAGGTSGMKSHGR